MLVFPGSYASISEMFTLGAHAQRGYSSWSECLSVTQHLTSRMFVRLTKDTTYLTGNEGQKFRTVFSETANLEREKANMRIDLPPQHALRTSETTQGLYRLSHAI